MFGDCDVTCDLEAGPWPWPDSSVDGVLYNHSLEHMGPTRDAFVHVIKETYRVCRDGAPVRVVVPNPRHDDYLDDPTHVRPITPRMLGLFSRKNCEYWESIKASNSPLAFHYDVDFETVGVRSILDPRFQAAHDAGELDLNALPHAIREYDILLRVVKPGAPRSEAVAEAG
jgi:hypothetical protein